MACNNDLSRGCKGGYPYYAWVFWKNNGIVTGGLYDSKTVSRNSVRKLL